MKHLVEVSNVSIDSTDEDGRTPLMLAMRENNTEIANFLIEKGSSIGAKDTDKQSLLHFAALSGALPHIHNITQLIHEIGLLSIFIQLD